jgi:hypothetical protein
MNRRKFFAELAGAAASIPALGKPKPPRMDYYAIEWPIYSTFGPGRVYGYSPLEAHRVEIQRALATQDFMAEYYKGGL